ncbi:MAG: Gfo/Idh/MocA family oxidoreductase [Pirellulales bacterium]|nr:Gfo/Idh/MocA family oxidoreductase [Pirellulales bacterium]
MVIQKKLRRRSFLKGIAAASVAPVFVRSSALGLAGTVPPSERITMGLIGCGIHGTGWNLDRMFENPEQQVLAVCDVDQARAAQAEQRVNDFYSHTLGKNYRACDVHYDFRELVNRRDIDAVDIATPDHWHVMIALMAIQAGKDVICEKPLSLTLSEGRILADAAKQSKQVFQTASENRSIDSYIRICELVRNQRIGRLQHIKVLLPGENSGRGNDDFKIQDPPATFNYEMWQGQAPAAPYCPARCHDTFRWNLAYSGGRLTDWGAHLIDLAQWANGSQETGPVEVEGTGTFPSRDAVWNTASAFDLHYKYANGVTMHIWNEVPAIKFEGTDGWIMFRGWRGPLQASDPAILESVIREDEIHLHRPRVLVGREDPGGGEHRDFIDCVKSRKPCYAPAEIGHRTVSIAHLGNIAMLLGRKLRWDPDIEQFSGDDQANAMLRREQRSPWSIANVGSWINVG